MDIILFLISSVEIPIELHLCTIAIANSPILLAISSILRLGKSEKLSSEIKDIILSATLAGVVTSESDILSNFLIAVKALSTGSTDSS